MNDRPEMRSDRIWTGKTSKTGPPKIQFFDLMGVPVAPSEVLLPAQMNSKCTFRPSFIGHFDLKRYEWPSRNEIRPHPNR